MLRLLLACWSSFLLCQLVWMVVPGNGQTFDPNNCSSRTEMSCNLMNLTIGECNLTSGICSCNESVLGDCFRLSDNYCVESPCYSYQVVDGTCRKGRRSKTVAILLSVFLINFGAANFYIEQYALAIPQIILGLVLCIFQFGSCAVAGTRDGETSVPCIVCCSINTVVSLLFLSWWIADLVIFATDMRLDGSGCPLY